MFYYIPIYIYCCVKQFITKKIKSALIFRFYKRGKHAWRGLLSVQIHNVVEPQCELNLSDCNHKSQGK